MKFFNTKNIALFCYFVIASNYISAMLVQKAAGAAFIVPPKIIAGKTLDSLVLKGIRHIYENGDPFSCGAGNGVQAYDVTYSLLDSRNRLHNLRRPTAIRYFCRELIAFFDGSLKVSDGLLQASKFWEKLADRNTRSVNSNYGYYVFHQPLPHFQNKTQYEWVMENLLRRNSRKAFINVNQPMHKDFESKDFPCTIGMQFFIRNNHVCNVVSSRCTDVFLGLPYNMGFFSVLTELVYKNLQEKLPANRAQQLRLGYTNMKSNFTQLYNQKKDQALMLVEGVASEKEADALADTSQFDQMPEIESAEKLLRDIYNKSKETKFMQWIYDNAGL